MVNPMDQGSDAVKRTETAQRIADELAGCGVKLVASLPDNWISELITHLAFYAGWPAAMTAGTIARKVFDARKP